MLRSGQFDNLGWDTLAKAHTANWELLRSRFGISFAQIPPLASLDELADISIQVCKEYLFTESFVDGLERRMPFASPAYLKSQSPLMPLSYMESKLSPTSPDYLKEQSDLFALKCSAERSDFVYRNYMGEQVHPTIRAYWDERLTSALKDHLIVTFAHRFFCDNLLPREQEECIDAVYKCRMESDKKYKFSALNKGGQKVRDLDAERESKKNYFKSRQRSCDEFISKIKTFLRSYEKLLEKGYRDLSEYDSDKKIQDLINTDIALIDQEVSAEATERYAAPNWPYSLAMACNWTTSPLAVKNDMMVFIRDAESESVSKNSLAFELAQFLGNPDWGPLLFQEAEDKSKRPAHVPFFLTKHRKTEIEAMIEEWQLQAYPVVELRIDKNSCPFVSVPYVKDATYKCRLPRQSYTVKGNSHSFEMPSEIQQMLNCYLVERTFHGYASMIALNCLQEEQRVSSSKFLASEYSHLPIVTRLRAPLVHPFLMQLLHHAIGNVTLSGSAISWMENCINEWNRTALPVLEEFFIHTVWASYGSASIDKVLNEIIAALTKNEGSLRRCDRLNFYRLLPIKDLPKRAPLELRKDTVSNQILARTYLSGLGIKLEYPFNPYKAMKVDLGRATAFDGADTDTAS